MKNKITPWDILNYSLQNIFFKGIEVDIAGVQKSEETIANFQWFLRRPSPLNVFWAVWPLPSMVLRWFFDVATIAFNGFRWFRTIGQTMQWFRWIVVVLGEKWPLSNDFLLHVMHGLGNRRLGRQATDDASAGNLTSVTSVNVCCTNVQQTSVNSLWA